MDPKTLVITIDVTALCLNLLENRRLKKKLHKQNLLLIQAAKLLESQDKTIDYLVAKLNESGVEMTEFDRIALTDIAEQS